MIHISTVSLEALPSRLSSYGGVSKVCLKNDTATLPRHSLWPPVKKLLNCILFSVFFRTEYLTVKITLDYIYTKPVEMILWHQIHYIEHFSSPLRKCNRRSSGSGSTTAGFWVCVCNLMPWLYKESTVIIYYLLWLWLLLWGNFSW